jgi:SAM-dependent methyltransferase
MASMTNPSKVLEVGCGEGYIANLINHSCLPAKVFACDLSTNHIKQAKESYPGVIFFIASIYNLPFKDGSIDLVIASEVLEHLDDPDLALKELERVTMEPLIISVPREPLWRFLNMIRGRYLTHFGNTPGHCGHWSKRGFIEFLNKRLEIIKVSSPLPWSICFCRKRNARN